MAFVKLKNLRGETIKVPKGSVGMFKNLGFYSDKEIAKEAKEESPFPEVDEEDEDEADTDESKDNKSEDEVFLEKVLKKPLASWNKEEVKRYAAINEIDLTGTKNVNEGKERIKAFMNDAE